MTTCPPEDEERNDEPDRDHRCVIGRYAAGIADTLMVSLVPPSTSSAKLADYQWTNEQIKLLTDIRFRLLAYVPLAVGAAVTLLSSTFLGSAAPSPLVMVAVGFLGFRITLAVVLYDLRNSQLYNALVHRAALIEEGLQIESYLKDSPNKYGGAHALRPGRYGALLRSPITHDGALALLYGSVLAAWVYPMAKGAAVFSGRILKVNNASLAECCNFFPQSIFVPDSGASTTLVALIPTAIAVFCFPLVLRRLDLFGVPEKAIYEKKNRPIDIEQSFYPKVDTIAQTAWPNWWRRLWGVRIGVFKKLGSGNTAAEYSTSKNAGFKRI